MTPSSGPKPASTGAARSDIRLVIADVDGTLVTKDKILTDRAREAVRKVRAAGIAFAITSGRPPRGMTMLVEPLSLDEPIAGFNGGAFVNPNLSLIDQRVLPADISPQVIATIQAHKLDVWVYRGNDWYTPTRHGPHVDREEWTVKFPPTVVANFDGLTDNVLKIVGVSDDLEAVAKCEADTQQQFGAHVSAARSQPYYLDVTHPEANKSFVVKRLSELLKVAPAQIATIGDMPNDVLMFKVSGLSIAMGNASAEVQHQATHVTTSYEDEGFANAMERFILAQG
jgi:Cof subfamily protein (haloacid dehalogenase superfamily)